MQQKEFSIVNRNAPEPDKQIRALSHLTVPQWWKHSEVRARGAERAVSQALDEIVSSYRLTPYELRVAVFRALAAYEDGGRE